MLREETVFGPIHSRRLGSSLGINLLPVRGKLCNFDCIYCECGWNRDGREDRKLPTVEDVRNALEQKLLQCNQDGVSIDSITFSGDGEPTLNPQFPEIIDAVLALRDRLSPGAKVSVLSNATLVWKPAIREALRKVDNPILKIDAPTDALAAVINRPAPGYSLARTVEALKLFEGDFILQTMFLSGPDFDSSAPEVLEGWRDIVRTLRPRAVMAYTLDRPAPAEGLRPFTTAQLEAMVAPLRDEGFSVSVFGKNNT